MIERFGRRFLTFWGLSILTVILLVAGGLACLDSFAARKGVVALIMIYCWLYNATIGATAYVAMSEIATGRLRSKTAALALLFQSAWGTFWTFILPFMFNPDKGNLGAKVAFIFGGLSVLCCIYVYMYHPETKGRSFEELDEMFIKGIPARQFAMYETEAQLIGKREKDQALAGHT
jgi:SP family general alpha glucoside:H+ symporter-like MFS transporter